MLDKLMCFITVLLCKSISYRSSILKYIQNQLVQLGYLFDILIEILCSFIKDNIPDEGIESQVIVQKFSYFFQKPQFSPDFCHFS